MKAKSGVVTKEVFKLVGMSENEFDAILDAVRFYLTKGAPMGNHRDSLEKIEQKMQNVG